AIPQSAKTARSMRFFFIGLTGESYPDRAIGPSQSAHLLKRDLSLNNGSSRGLKRRASSCRDCGVLVSATRPSLPTQENSDGDSLGAPSTEDNQTTTFPTNCSS